MDVIIQNLRERGLKVTRQREIIVNVFQKMDHVTVEELHELVREREPSIGRITIYRLLRLLCRLGLARERHFGDNRTIYDNIVTKDHHDHLICIRCGKIVEFSSERIERLQVKIAERKGFSITNHRLEISGICEDCR